MLMVRKTGMRAKANRLDIQNKQSEATVYLYSDIGGWFGINHEEWVKDFNQIDASTIHLRIDSSGGDVFAARTMKTAIMQHKAKVIAHIDGLAASAAAFLATGADEIEIVDGGFLMIHNAMSALDILGYFNIDDLDELISDMTKERELHLKLNESIANDFMKRSGRSLEQVLAWMSETKWFTAKEAVENKFADRIYDGEPVEGSYDLSVFANVPDALKNRNTKASKRMIEKALRDAGLSSKEAKKILADGFNDDQRDVASPINPLPAVPEPQRDVAPVAHRDVEQKPKKDRVSDLLIRAEMMAPAQLN